MNVANTVLGRLVNLPHTSDPDRPRAVVSGRTVLVTGASFRLGEAMQRRSTTRALDAEVAALEGAAGTRMHPTPTELAAMSANFMDPRRRIAALDTAVSQVPAQLDRAENAMR